jgi:2-heptyl-1-hydroxyquinolin-4(1H)-one methyltransferase
MDFMSTPNFSQSLQQEFDAAYRSQSAELGGIGNRPPWSLGEPQPAVTALIDAGSFHGDILDAGCGEAAAAIELAQRGFTTVGIDISPSAIELARAEAARRRLANATFEVADISTLTGYDNRFGTILDCTLFHSMPVELRAAYQQSIARVAASGATYIVLAFDATTVPVGLIFPVSREELRDAVSAHWVVEDIAPTRIHANIVADYRDHFSDLLGSGVRYDTSMRATIPAWLLLAHLKQQP